ncbi:MAG TPA: CHAP domain-containing protein [Acetobacteraceae bacterium]|nr:CHAP domain-containing protein [Acetobacteraceae bacterium]
MALPARHAWASLLLLALASCGGASRYAAIGTPTSLTCVPYVEEVTGISLTGDAYSWWREAAGRYPRLHRPVVGAVLVFRPTDAMPLGHVSVVTAILSRREILVEHANWVPYRITEDQPVIDVSAANDWSRVRVWYPPIDALGTSVFPVYGFVLPQPRADLARAGS